MICSRMLPDLLLFIIRSAAHSSAKLAFMVNKANNLLEVVQSKEYKEGRLESEA